MAIPGAIAVGVAIVAVAVIIDEIVQIMAPGNLSLAERTWLYTHPSKASKVRDCTRTAFAKEKEFFGTGGEDDEGDAFRHCYWSALLTRDIGQADSGFFTSLHEEKDDNPEHKKTMDLHNNGVGRWAYFADTSDEGLAKGCMKLLATGKLLVHQSVPAKLTKAKELSKDW